jgi:hypothetical protein
MRHIPACQQCVVSPGVYVRPALLAFSHHLVVHNSVGHGENHVCSCEKTPDTAIVAWPVNRSLVATQ